MIYECIRYKLLIILVIYKNTSVFFLYMYPGGQYGFRTEEDL